MIDFDGATDNQKVSWGNQASLSPNLLTIIAWIDFDSVTTAGAARIINQYDISPVPVTDRAWIVNLYVGSKVFFATSTTGVEENGVWTIPITTGTHCIAITFDFSSVTNNPVIYVDGASVVVTELITPTGTFPSGTANLSFSIGDTDLPADPYDPFDGRVLNCTIYNRILSSAEILDAYNSRLAIPNYYLSLIHI